MKLKNIMLLLSLCDRVSMFEFINIPGYSVYNTERFTVGYFTSYLHK